MYYMLAPGGQCYNYSGCGNTFNCNHPVVRQFIVDCLRYWVQEMHVDGFRCGAGLELGGCHSWGMPRLLLASREPGLALAAHTAELTECKTLLATLTVLTTHHYCACPPPAPQV